MRKKYVYFFGDGKAEGSGEMKDLLGGKGAGLAEMTNAGLPVPPGFTITTEACIHYYKAGETFPDGLSDQVLSALGRVETVTGKTFGGQSRPLLVSVRSGAKFSMPGMMDTVLNLGLNETTLQALAAESGDERFAYDAYRRFIQMFGRIVLGVDGSLFERLLEEEKKRKRVTLDTELTVGSLKLLAAKFKSLIKQEKGVAFPTDPHAQLRLAIQAVFGSWFGKRAVDYRRVHKIPNELGTAVNVVTMVFGNLGEDSGTGVAFTRDPATGRKQLYGEYLHNAQGEDVVAGTRTPKKISELREQMPAVYEQLAAVAGQLERHYRDVQDVEFTVERGKLWMLQTRSAKRTGPAAVKIAVDMVGEGLIDRATALLRVDPNQLDQLLHHRVDPKANAMILARGLPASPGAAIGLVVFDPDEAEKLGQDGKKVILVREETSPDDFHGMVAAQAILTARGGMTSHAAVVARGMGKCCVVGAEQIQVNYQKQEFVADGIRIKKGEFITLDGSNGLVIKGQVPLIEPDLGEDFYQLMQWANEVRRLGVRANADTPRDAIVARNFGAEGIGLCRTEHMFFEENRIDTVRQMIVFASDYKQLEKGVQAAEQELRQTRTKSRQAALRKELARLRREIRKPRKMYFGALRKLLPMQRRDFLGIFRAMNGLPVTIRTLDPPLHEFLPREEAELAALAKRLKINKRELVLKVHALRETNPMLGHRGCRLGITYPEVTEMQARAIFEAAVEVKKRGVYVVPEIMVPLVSDVRELVAQIEVVRRVANEVAQKSKVEVEYLVGTMIELPRAAITAGQVARVAEFFSFGTNDLTQTTFGLSRDDAGKFLPGYVANGILNDDPFQVLDREGVGELIRIGVEKGRIENPKLKVGICGEHGGEPRSVEFCHHLGLNYVSCSPYRVPIAIVAAAQAALQEIRKKDRYTTA
jgi:pyruvate,orthophosphate dikinase